MMSMGHKYSMVIISHLKWVLRTDMPPEMRLKFLGYLDKWVDGTLTPAVIAMIEPMDERGLEIFDEARKLGYGRAPDFRRPNFFDVLYEKFDVFATLNPSLRAAYDEACRPWKKAFEEAS